LVRDAFRELFYLLNDDFLRNERCLDALIIEVAPPSFDGEPVGDSITELWDQAVWEKVSRELLEEG